MAYRNGTYIAFDGQGTTSPDESDIKYFNLLKAWKKSGQDFKFSDSHKKTYQVRDSSYRETLKRRLRERLNESKNFVLILSEDTRADREMLNYEKIQAPTELASYWPSSLSKAIKNRTVKCIHIPFKKAPIFDAISQFTIHSDNTLSSLSYYSSDAYKKFGII